MAGVLGGNKPKGSSGGGYRYQDAIVKQLVERLSSFKTVTLKTAKGDLITLENFRQRGPDGGMDLVIEIDAATENACRQVAGRVRAIIEKLQLDHPPVDHPPVEEIVVKPNKHVFKLLEWFVA